MTKCPHCKSDMNPVTNRCKLCGRAAPEPVRPAIYKSFSDIGKEIVRAGWGRHGSDTLEELIGASKPELQTVSLLAAILQELQETRKAIGSAASKISRATERAPPKLKSHWRKNGKRPPTNNARPMKHCRQK